MGDVGTRIANVPIHLTHNTDVLIAVEQRILVLTVAAGTAVRSLVGLKTGIGQDNDQALRVLVCGRDGCALLGNQLRKRGRRKRLSARSLDSSSSTLGRRHDEEKKKNKEEVGVCKVLTLVARVCLKQATQ
jgi:hypothetical protein